MAMRIWGRGEWVREIKDRGSWEAEAILFSGFSPLKLSNYLNTINNKYLIFILTGQFAIDNRREGAYIGRN